MVNELGFLHADISQHPFKGSVREPRNHQLQASVRLSGASLESVLGGGCMDGGRIDPR